MNNNNNKLKESEKKDKYLVLTRELKKDESDSDTSFNWYTWYNPQRNDIGNSGGARGVMVIIVGNGHGDTSSNLGRD